MDFSFFTTKKKSNNITNNKIYNYEIVSFPDKNKNFGNYTGTYPKQAAQKAFTFLSTLVGDEIKKDGRFVVFSIRKKNSRNNASANTSTNRNKVHKFIGTVVELENYIINSKTNKKVKLKNVVSKYNPALDNIKSSNITIKYKS